MPDPVVTYAIQVGDQFGRYPEHDDFARALHAAYDELRIQCVDFVTVLRVESDTPAGDLTITALATITPGARA